MSAPKLSFSLALAALLLTLAGCGTTRVVSDWASDSIEPEKPEKLAVMVAWPEELQRLSWEHAMVERLRAAGANAVAAMEIPGLRAHVTPEVAEKALRNANADALLIVFLAGGGGATDENANDWSENAGSAVYGWYAPYFYDLYEVREGPGYSGQGAETLLETTFVDLRRVERVWSFVTRSGDSEYQDVVGQLTDRVVRRMQRSGQL